MAKRRTKSQKRAAKHTYSYVFDGAAEGSATPKSVPAAQNKVRPNRMEGVALITETKFVVGDMLRTLMFSLLILGIELGIYWYWRG